MSRDPRKLLSLAKLRAARQTIVRELPDFRNPEYDYVRVYELSNGEILWTHEETKVHGHHASVFPSVEALWEWLDRPPMDYTPRSFEDSVSLAEDAFTAEPVESFRLKLSSVIGIPEIKLDYSETSVKVLEKALKKISAFDQSDEERLVPIVVYFGEAVRRATAGAWLFERNRGRLHVFIRTASGRKVDFKHQASGLLDENRRPDWYSIFEELKKL